MIVPKTCTAVVVSGYGCCKPVSMWIGARRHNSIHGFCSEHYRKIVRSIPLHDVVMYSYEDALAYAAMESL